MLLISSNYILRLSVVIGTSYCLIVLYCLYTINKISMSNSNTFIYLIFSFFFYTFSPFFLKNINWYYQTFLAFTFPRFIFLMFKLVFGWLVEAWFIQNLAAPNNFFFNWRQRKLSVIRKVLSCKSNHHEHQ